MYNQGQVTSVNKVGQTTKTNNLKYVLYKYTLSLTILKTHQYIALWLELGNIDDYCKYYDFVMIAFDYVSLM